MYRVLGFSYYNSRKCSQATRKSHAPKLTAHAFGLPFSLRPTRGAHHEQSRPTHGHLGCGCAAPGNRCNPWFFPGVDSNRGFQGFRGFRSHGNANGLPGGGDPNPWRTGCRRWHPRFEHQEFPFHLLPHTSTFVSSKECSVRPGCSTGPHGMGRDHQWGHVMSARKSP